MGYLDKLLSEAEGYDAYEAEPSHFSVEENFEVENYVRAGMGMRQAQTLVLGKRGAGNIAIRKNNINTTEVVAGENAAQFDIVVTRDSNTIVVGGKAVNLPFAVFGASDSENGYKSVLAPYIPNGVTLASVKFGANAGATYDDRLVFEYTDGTHTDTVTVTCAQYEYPSFLSEMKGNNTFKLDKIRYTINNTSILAQFNQPFVIGTRTMFGKSAQNKISVTAYKRPDQFQAGIIDLLTVVTLTKSDTIISLMDSSAPAGFSVTLSSFVTKYERHKGA